MPQLTDNAFTFQSSALPRDTFTVIRFTGEEGLSMLYRFDILLISEQEDIDLTTVLQNPATFTIKGLFSGGGELPFHGILANFEQMHQAGQYFFYQAELRPKLWWLTLTHHNQVFLGKKAKEFLTGVLEDGGLSEGPDFEFRYQGPYPVRQLICQYEESHFAFLSRWMERAGCYYWFEQGEQSEKMIATDTLIAHTPLPGHEEFRYSPPSGLDAADADRVIKRFTLKQRPLPKNVLIRDYNYMKPGLDLSGKSQVQNTGRGDIYLYGMNAKSKREAEGLARIRAEEYRSQEKEFHGMSAIPAVRSGFVFTLQKHFRDDFNQKYLTTTVHHEGSQERYLLSGLGIHDLEDAEGLFYRNTFECIPASTQFRPARTTPKPRIAGTLSARIDAAGSGQYAELDKYGRYKVILPFDLSGRSGGKASTWLRMMQPYAGDGMGFHAPLHKGTEVLLSFIDGDPDRPIIAGAVPNTDTPSPVRDANQTQVRLVSGSGNVMHMEDEKGKERILMHSPTAGSWVRIGYRNDPDDPEEPEEPEENTKEVEDPQSNCMHDDTEGIKVHSEKTLTFESGDFCTIVHGDEFMRVNGEERYIIDGEVTHMIGGTDTTMVGGNVFEGVLGATEEVLIGFKIGLELAGAFELESIVKGEVGLGWKWTFHEMEEKFHIEKDHVGALRNELVGEINKLIGDHNKLTGAVNKMAGVTEELAGEVYQVNGAQQLLRGAIAKVAGEESEAVGETLKTIGNVTRMHGNDILACASKLKTAADDTELLGIKEIV